MRRIDNPYRANPRQYSHRTKKVSTILHKRTIDQLRRLLNTDYAYDVGYIPPGYEHRPDKISTVFYGTPDNWWLLLMANSIMDPLDGFKVNQKIKIPKL